MVEIFSYAYPQAQFFCVRTMKTKEKYYQDAKIVLGVQTCFWIKCMFGLTAILRGIGM
jgi:hypothetical protein